MKEIYAWVPWFKELGQTIADGDADDLLRRAKAVQWREGNDAAPISLFKYGDDKVDPFSFVYTLASRCGSVASRTRICTSVKDVFGLNASMPVENDDAFIFPQGPLNNTLFHNDGAGNLPLLWRLFRDAVRGVSSVSDADFSEALEIGNIRIAKLSQALFLINAADFIPYDKATARLRVGASNVEPDLSGYREAMSRLRDRFPGCEPWEVNLFAYLVWSDQLTVRKGAFQVSTKVYNDGRDFWENFNDNNWVFTGGRDSGLSWQDYVDDDRTRGTVTYPLEVPDAGDLMLVRNAGEAKAIGVVYRNDYRGALTAESRLHVVWLNKRSGQLGGGRVLGRGFSGAIEYAEAFRRIDAYAPTFEIVDELTDGGEEPTPTEPSSPDPASGQARVANPPRNLILHGPPGTGKTWATVNLALAIIDGKSEVDHDLERYHALRESGRIAAVTFHQNFAYEDFIEGIRPGLGDVGGLRYELRDGLFKTMAESARNAPASQRFVLIIDEINRGNVARIFGELITLIEDSRRDDGPERTVVKLPYSGEEFSVPGNLYLIGTMNTADRSIELLDTALRRRFVFRELMPDTGHPDLPEDVGGVDCRRLLCTINERITLLLDREHQIGHTYLLNVSSLEELGQRFRERIFPLLQEYFFDDWAKIHAVLGRNSFLSSSNRDLPELADHVVEDQRIWQRLPDSDPEWISAAAYRAIYQADADADAS